MSRHKVSTKKTDPRGHVWTNCGCGLLFLNTALWEKHRDMELTKTARAPGAAEEGRRRTEVNALRLQLDELRAKVRDEALDEASQLLSLMAAVADETLAQNGGDGPATQRMAGRADALRSAITAVADLRSLL